MNEYKAFHSRETTSKVSPYLCKKNIVPTTQNLPVRMALASWIKAGGYKVIERHLIFLDQQNCIAILGFPDWDSLIL